MKETTRFFICLLGLLAASLLIAGCMGSAPTATEGDTVKVNYTGTLPDGTTFDSSIGREPLEFTLGEGQVIPGFEDAVLGMAVGEEKTVTIPVEEAYGEYDEERMLTVEREFFPDELTEVGTSVMVPLKSGQTTSGVVSSVNDTYVVLDMNHPLAGEDLTFWIELIEIV